jgi:CubicO group peptidase (beta-lactamase class C family)
MASSNPDIYSHIDALLSPIYPPDKPGAAVIVTKGGEVIFRKGYGLANLELRVSIEPHMVFRIGSITKQFTAVCILMLCQQGKLSLQDDITSFLPDYPTGGRNVTIENLLSHTSGITDYTDKPEYTKFWREDVRIERIIDIFRNLPFEFEPGEQFRYSNSGYILLGAVIEKISGMQYAEFLNKNIFMPLGMSHTRYDNPDQIVPGRVAGYQYKENKYLNAPYLSMTLPHAAGALASSVDDLALWDTALSAGEIVKPEMLEQAFTSAVLKNGDSTQYGYGWSIFEHEGITFMGHSGDINGFCGSSLRIPSENVFMALLTNCENPVPHPATLVKKLGGLTIGKPVEKPIPIDVAEDVLDRYVGVYQISRHEQRVITRHGKQLYSQRSGCPKLEIYPSCKETFFFKDISDRFFFEHDQQGQIVGMKVMRDFGPPERCSLITLGAVEI